MKPKSMAQEPAILKRAIVFATEAHHALFEKEREFRSFHDDSSRPYGESGVVWGIVKIFPENNIM